MLRSKPNTTDETPVPQGKWFIFSLVAVGIFMSTLDGSIVNVALPTIMEDFTVSLATIEWVVIIYLLTVSSLLLSFGRLSDIRGRRWVYSKGLLVFSLGSLFCALAKNAVWLIAARSFQGIGAAMIMACTPALVVETFPAAERGRALGMMATVVASGLTTGPALGGLLIHLFSWRVIFYINVPIGIVTALVISPLLRGGQADRTADEPFDWAGSALLSASLICLVLVVSHGYSWGYTAALTILFASISGVCAAVFVWREVKVPYPIVELKLFAIRLFSLPLLSAASLFMSLFTVVFLMPFYLVHPCGFPIGKVGLLMVTPFVFLFFVSPIAGAIYDRIGSRVLCTVGMIILAVALVCLAMISSPQSTVQIMWKLALAGIGTAIFLPPNSSAALTAVPANRRGIAAGTVATARNLGMVMGVALAGTIFNTVFHTLSNGLTLKVYTADLAPVFMSSFRYAMMAGGAVAAIGAVLAALRGAEKTVKH